MLPSPTLLSVQEVTTAKGNTERLATVEVTVTLIDSESGESFTIKGLGSGQDPSDKAIAKAQTIGIKYAYSASDPDKSETLNNRKTTRQIFAYKPKNGLLLQSRLYNTHGGTCGAQAESKLYRDLVQREISELEGVPNLWKTETFHVAVKFPLDFTAMIATMKDWNFVNPASITLLKRGKFLTVMASAFKFASTA